MRGQGTRAEFGCELTPGVGPIPPNNSQLAAGLAADPIATAAGTLTAAVGLCVLLGYHLGKPVLIQGYSGFSPMAYATAVCFVLLGGALPALHLGWRAVSLLSAGGAGLLMLFSMIGHAGGHSLEVSAMLSRVLLGAGAPPAVPVAPNTALAIGSLAFAMLSLSSAQATRWRSGLAVLLCALGIALGVNAFAGYLTGLQTYGWGAFQPMAIHTAGGVILLGAGILTLSWRGMRGDEMSKTASILVIAATAGTVTSISFWQALALLERAPIKSTVHQRSWMPETVLFAGLVVTALLGVTVYLARVARLRTALAEFLRNEAEDESAQRKVTLDALMTSENLLRSVIDASTDRIFVKDRNLRTVLCNPIFAKALGKSVSDVCGKTDIENGWAPELVRGVPAQGIKGREGDDLRALSGETVHVLDVQGNIEGGIHYLDTIKTPLRGSGDEIIGLVGVSRDITDQKLAHEELQLSRERLVLALKAGHSGTFDWDIKSNINAWSPEIEELYGVAPGTFGGRYESWEELLLPEDLETARAATQESLRTGEFASEWRVRRPNDGQIRWLAARARVFFDNSGRPSRMLGINVDITERKQAEHALAQRTAELARSNAELEQFAYVASHDLQEPLRMVANFTQLLADRYSDKLDQDARDFIGYAVEGAARMQTLIRDLLALSRVGTRGKDFEVVRAGEALRLAAANLEFAIRETGAVLSHDELPAVLADSSQMTQLFQNLVGNAVKFKSVEPPRVHISAVRSGREWTFSVSDNGIGFEPQYAERIFKVFQRLHTRDDYAGTGMGLAICRKIVERHHGRIWAESTPGSGATFYFTIPAAGVPAKRADQTVGAI